MTCNCACNVFSDRETKIPFHEFTCWIKLKVDLATPKFSRRLNPSTPSNKKVLPSYAACKTSNYLPTQATLTLYSVLEAADSLFLVTHFSPFALCSEKSVLSGFYSNFSQVRSVNSFDSEQIQALIAAV